MAVWYSVCLCKLLWNIASRKESLWVKWVHSLRLKDNESWAKWLCCRGGIPRYSFVSWVLFNGKMCTKDRLNKWGIQVDPTCVFCEEEESKDHLFFECEFAASVWRLVLQKMKLYIGAANWVFER
ncbi:hypothetical protein LIER_43851 [Lithospermum erythrorhizon]|uniref:Reverse transcriptase zinc-binding domain-containing protein n=1 Tax=Lithospermum erythrorhizon TaxID=34254 RepID=A0AAV3R2L5_LITER